MRTVLIIFFNLAILKGVYSQITVKEILQFYNDSNKEYFFNLILKETRDSIYNRWHTQDPKSNELLDLSMKVLDNEFKLIRQEDVRYFLRIQLNIQQGIKNKDIYNKIKIDSILPFGIFIMHERKNNHIKAAVNDYLYDEFKKHKGKLLYKKLQKKKPDIILYCEQLSFIGFSHAFMYLKDDEIFIYRMEENEFIELNEYFSNLYSKNIIPD